MICQSVSVVRAQCASEANVYNFEYLNRTYEIIKEQKTWEGAAACAVQRGGHLVHIDSLGEQDALYDALLSSGISATYTTVSDGGGIAYVWIGATDKGTEGAWLWDGDNDGQGTPFWNGQGGAGNGIGQVVEDRYVNWGGISAGTQKEPDDYQANQDAAAIALAGWPKSNSSLGIASEWNDINITNQLYYVVEYDNIAGYKETEDLHVLYSVSPNPCKDQLTIQSNSSITKISIVDLMGQVTRTIDVSASPSSIFTLDVSQLPKGLYLLEVESATLRVRSTKFLKD